MPAVGRCALIDAQAPNFNGITRIENDEYMLRFMQLGPAARTHSARLGRCMPGVAHNADPKAALHLIAPDQATRMLEDRISCSKELSDDLRKALEDIARMASSAAALAADVPTAYPISAISGKPAKEERPRPVRARTYVPNVMHTSAPSLLSAT